jgi:ubiquinone/menaquinone biosynthesis C-methylase UbiE
VSPTVEEWHQQFLRQAGWTTGIRSRLYGQAELRRAGAVLDVGCGTGVITEELSQRTRGTVTGLDLDPAMIGFAAGRIPDVEWIVGDAHCLPFPSESFDLVLCSFLLLWTTKPGLAVQEMARVVREGGVVLAVTEPDYGGRIDYPEDIALGPLMEDSLRAEGANPRVGRSLKALLSAAGLEAQSGIIGSMWDDRQMAEEFEAEWAFIFETLSNVAEEVQLRAYRDAAWRALQEGARVVFMPHFWGLGRKLTTSPV